MSVQVWRFFMSKLPPAKKKTVPELSGLNQLGWLPSLKRAASLPQKKWWQRETFRLPFWGPVPAYFRCFFAVSFREGKHPIGIIYQSCTNLWDPRDPSLDAPLKCPSWWPSQGWLGWHWASCSSRTCALEKKHHEGRLVLNMTPFKQKKTKKTGFAKQSVFQGMAQ